MYGINERTKRIEELLKVDSETAWRVYQKMDSDFSLDSQRSIDTEMRRVYAELTDETL